MEGARDHFTALLRREFVEHDRVAADAQAQIGVLVGMLHGVLQHRFVEHVDVDVLRVLQCVCVCVCVCMNVCMYVCVGHLCMSCACCERHVSAEGSLQHMQAA